MNQLSNAFSLLDLDVADNQDQTQVDITPGNTDRVNGRDNQDEIQVDITPGNTDRVNGRGKEKLKYGGPGEINVLEQEQEDQYKLPLVWIDLEMTGLNIEVDRILEIACIVTDGNLTKSIEGPDLVIHQAKEHLDSMGEWCQEHHAASGLTEKVLNSTVTEEEAEKQKYMPDLASLFSHVLVDVSSIKALRIRWYPRDNKKAPKKQNNHRAMDDIKESIAELKYYKEHIFIKASKYKK